MPFVQVDNLLNGFVRCLDVNGSVNKNKNNLEWSSSIGWGYKPKSGRVCSMLFTIILQVKPAFVFKALLDFSQRNVVLLPKLLQYIRRHR
ncbi:hypothetical protein Bpro_2979 [Polaromonas sp. JS666]|nr:hypothetical protein Bpro_2979 [Polaromonas sp. JS666]